MNEQLIVKNFGPIKDATVDFKRVTVFIGPTGGGKSTLAKLAAIIRDDRYTMYGTNRRIEHSYLNDFKLTSFKRTDSKVLCFSEKYRKTINFEEGRVSALISEETEQKNAKIQDEVTALLIRARNTLAKINSLSEENAIAASNQVDILITSAESNLEEVYKSNREEAYFIKPHYIPSERIFTSSLEYSWAGLMRDDIGLPTILLDFANNFSLSRKDVSELRIPFFGVDYKHIDGRDFIIIPDREEPLMLSETASGVQSVTPLLVLLEHLSRNTEQAQSFIIEEPELNLFPLAQFELIKILIEKCAQTEGKNDLVLTTHSPYVLTALNLLCYAYRIAQQDEATAKKVAKLIPRHCWIDPDQFAAYYVDRPDTKRKQQVRSIINKKTGLIEENELDTASEELGAIFDKLVRLRKPTSTSARAN